jgi:hypothetical protein
VLRRARLRALARACLHLEEFVGEPLQLEAMTDGRHGVVLDGDHSLEQHRRLLRRAPERLQRRPHLPVELLDHFGRDCHVRRHVERRSARDVVDAELADALEQAAGRAGGIGIGAGSSRSLPTAPAAAAVSEGGGVGGGR